MWRKLSLVPYYLFRYPVYYWRLGTLGARARLLGTRLTGAKRIFIGSKVYIHEGGWLAAEPLTGDPACRLEIGDGTYIGRFAHIYATSGITIGKKVLIADKVYIADNLHGFENPDLPVMDQPVKQTARVTIGEGAWLGENACIIGASVGRHSIVGANAVLTRDLPDYSMALGVPARIVKRYCFDKKAWLPVNSQGEFLS